jgi:hypothetical protein
METQHINNILSLSTFAKKLARFRYVRENQHLAGSFNEQRVLLIPADLRTRLVEMELRQGKALAEM